MIKENIGIIIRRSTALVNALRLARIHLEKYVKADDFVTLTAGQRTSAITEFDALKTDYQTARDEFETAVSATEEIVKEER